MKLSIVIVNYNVKHFLEQCLRSVHKAVLNIDAEIYVVDNNSVDQSMEMVAKKFPDVKRIANSINTGFSVANNQAIKISKGEYILLLNPDTLVEEDTFEKCITFMDNKHDVGGLGVKMVDGKGKFLPESKRSLPTPKVAFYKIFGLSNLFPKSKQFGAYHLGHLPEDETNEVEILAGAFMLLRKKALDDIGLLDETFFMYGEDIDLSYRLIKGGYKNYYFPETRIIHYKGESTKKGSLNYVFLFYKAMVVFAKKHFSNQNAKLFSLLINMAIYLRAGLSIIRRFLSTSILPIFDFSFIFSGMMYLKMYWEINHRYITGGTYPEILTLGLIPMYITVWLTVFKLSGVYDKPFKLDKLIRGSLYGVASLLVIYALLPEPLRFSRAIILLGSAWAGVSVLISRILFRIIGLKSFQWGESLSKRFLIVGSEKESVRIHDLLNQTEIKMGFVGFIHSEKPNQPSHQYVGLSHQLEEAVLLYAIDEVVFCSKNLSAQEIIEHMSKLDKHSLDFKIAPEESMYVIGSNSINTKGEFYGYDLSSINKIENRRNKRTFDIFSALIIISISPIFMLLGASPKALLKNTMSVLLGFKTWVSYYGTIDVNHLPTLKEGIISPLSHLKSEQSKNTASKLNMLYAKDYRVKNDVNFLLKNLKRLARY